MVEECFYSFLFIYENKPSLIYQRRPVTRVLLHQITTINTKILCEFFPTPPAKWATRSAVPFHPGSVPTFPFPTFSRPNHHWDADIFSSRYTCDREQWVFIRTSHKSGGQWWFLFLIAWPLSTVYCLCILVGFLVVIIGHKSYALIFMGLIFILLTLRGSHGGKSFKTTFL